MKRTYYNAIVKWTSIDGKSRETHYDNYKKITYRIWGRQLKVRLCNWNGSVATEEFTNVETIRITKYRK